MHTGEGLTASIKSRLKYGRNFDFINEITFVDPDHIEGHYRFTGREFFYESHFLGQPVIPGVILIEMMGQIGMVAHYAWMQIEQDDPRPFHPLMSQCSAEFYVPAKVNERMTVKAQKKYFRANLLRSEVLLYNADAVLVARVEALLKIVNDSNER